MKHILQLLNEKNFFLEKFYFINENEIENFRRGDFSNLEIFYSEREGLLNLIGKIDLIVEEFNLSEKEVHLVSDEDKKKIIQFIDKKNEWVSEILSQDLEILSFVEEEKSNIIKELSKVRTIKKAIKHYESNEEY